MATVSITESFTQKEDEHLVGMVSKNPCLYDKTDANYKNLLKRERVWEEIGKEMNKLVSDCKLRWKNIRGAYQRQKTRNKQHPRCKYDVYHKMLAFLHNTEEETNKEESGDGEDDENEDSIPRDETGKGKSAVIDDTENFDSEDDEILTQMISQYPILYDTSMVEFRNVGKREAIWNEIGKVMRKSGKNCKLRWKGIRDTYVRAEKRNKLKPAMHKKSKLHKYRKMLAFLNKHIDDESENESSEKPQESTKRKMVFIPTEGSEPTMTDSENEDNPFGEASETFVCGEDSSSDYLQSLKPRKNIKKEGFKRRRVEEEPITRPSKEDLQLQQRRLNQTSSTSNQNDEEIDLFARQARTIILKLPPYLQIKAMQEVFDVLTKYKMLAVQNDDANASTSADDPFFETSVCKVELDCD